MIQTVVKRDGRIVGFNARKIGDAVRKAMVHTEAGENEELIHLICEHVANRGKVQMTVEGGLLRQCPNHYAFHAGQNLPDKEFRYLRTVIRAVPHE